MIPDHVLSDIKARNPIEGIASELVSGLAQRGRVFKACCPFHEEKTPSFTVDPAKGSYKCYGCAASGDVIALLCKLRNLEFMDAVRELAERANITLDLGPPASPQQREQQQKDKQRKGQIFKVLDAAQDWFAARLRDGSPESNNALEYLFGRGLTLETLDRFGVGYAPRDRQALREHLFGVARRPGRHLLDLFAQAGLFGKDEQRAEPFYYPRFCGRVMVPIRWRGKVVSFGGRVVEPGESEKKPPKYVNGSESPVFRKCEVLFGLDEAGKAIRTSGTAVVVEGYMDVLACVALGHENAVACMGTAFTDRQARALQLAGARGVVALLDADKAGEQAYEKLLPVCLSAGLTVRKARL